MADADGRVFWFNRHWYDYTGAKAEDHEIREWQTYLAPDSGLDARRSWIRSLNDGTPLETEASLLGKDGWNRPFLTRVIPLRDAASTVYRWIGTRVDISEQRRREEHVRFIIDELSHRTKGLLAVVMAIANQTAQYADDAPQYQTRLLDRLQELAQCHDLLVKDNWRGASFHDLVSSQMRPFGEMNADRIDAGGPHIILRPGRRTESRLGSA
jgi:PAS domain S-box-containing protein